MSSQASSFITGESTKAGTAMARPSSWSTWVFASERPAPTVPWQRAISAAKVSCWGISSLSMTMGAPSSKRFLAANDTCTPRRW